MNQDFDISQLTAAECILLAEQLWEQARNRPEAVPTPPEHLQELQRRLDAFERGEMAPGAPWEEVDAWLGTL